MGKGLGLAKFGMVALALWATAAATAVADDVAFIPQKANNCPVGPQCPEPPDCYVQPQSTWYLRAEGGAMLRGQSEASLFQVSNTNPVTTAVPVLVTWDIPYQFAGAGNFVIGKNITDCFQIESQFTGMLAATSSASMGNVTPNGYYKNTAETQPVLGNMFSPFANFGGETGIGIAGLDYNKYAEISCSSAFRTVELNLRRRVPLPTEIATMTVLCGLRYTSVPEEFDYYTVSDVTASGTYVANGAINDIRISTKNEMIGPQIGALVEFYTEGHWWFNIDAKVALMSNSCEETSNYRNVNNGVTTNYVSSDTSNSTSILSDINITCIYRWSPHLTSRLGYHFVWLNNLALAQDNFSNEIEVYRSGVTHLTGLSSAIYQGPFVGIDLSW